MLSVVFGVALPLAHVHAIAHTLRFSLLRVCVYLFVCIKKWLIHGRPTALYIIYLKHLNEKERVIGTSVATI